LPKAKEKISLLPVFGVILGSLCLTAALFFIAFQYYRHLVDKNKTDSKYNIAAVIQTGPEKEPLPTSYLIELMDLSVDKPLNLYAANESELKSKLLASPLIKKASIQKSFPHLLIVDYEARRPIAYLKDYSNTLLSEDGKLIPFKPFFSPKNFPKVYLGACIEGWKIPEKKMGLIRESIHTLQGFFEERNWPVHFLDFSSAFLVNKERSEIVVYAGEHLIRLGADSYERGLSLFDRIIERERLRTRGLLRLIIDLRVDGMALVKSI